MAKGGDFAEESHSNTTSSSAMALTLQESESRHLLYTKAGLLLDTISSSVTVFHLTGALFTTGEPDSLFECGAERVWQFPLRQLLAWQKVTAATQHVYIVENPQVFEELIDRLSTHDNSKPTLVCSAGWPSVATLKLLDLLIAQTANIRLHYSGDFDRKGLEIAFYLLRRFPQHCLPWRFDAATYHQALQAGGIAVSNPQLEAMRKFSELFPDLVVAMRIQAKWAYQEGIIQQLLDDIF